MLIKYLITYFFKALRFILKEGTNRPVKIASFGAKHQRNCNINVLWRNIFQTPYILVW